MPPFSIVEMIAALDSGCAAKTMQRQAAPVAAVILNGGRLPPGVPLNRRGRPATSAWNAPEVPVWGGDAPDKYVALAALSGATATPAQQKYIAFGLRFMIAEYRLFARKKHEKRGRRQLLLKIANDRTGLAEFVQILAGVYRRRGSKRPVEDALLEVARVHENKPVETVRRYYKAGLSKLKVVRGRPAKSTGK